MDTANLNELIRSAKSPAILCSFGKDSLLLVALSRQLGYDLPIIWFRDGTDESTAMQFIYDWTLTCYSWEPANLYLLTYNGSTALISEFSLNGQLLPVLTDAQPTATGRCLANQPRTPNLYLPFDLLLTGYKDCDSHWAVDGAQLHPTGTAVGGIRLESPLRLLTDDQVLDELNQLGIAYTDRADTVAICADCSAGKPLHWSQPLDLTAFKGRLKL